MLEIRAKNESIKGLKQILKQSPKQSLLELDNILSNVQDRKAFIFLLDLHETEKEIARELLEEFIDVTFDINNDIIDKLFELSEVQVAIKNEDNLVDKFFIFFSFKNIKGLLVFSLVMGIVLSITLNNDVAIKLINAVTTVTSDKKDK